MRPTLGTVSAKGVYRISKSYDGVGAMARTPHDLALLVESILTPEATAKLPNGSFGEAMTKSWQGLKIGLVESTWGLSGKEAKEKWTSDRVVSR